MAFAHDASISIVGSGTTSGTTLDLGVTGANIAVGKLVVIAIAKDNAGTTDADHGEVASISDDSAGGNAWLKAGEFTNGQGGANAGATVSVWYTVVTSEIPAGAGRITASFTSSVTKKAATGAVFTIGAGSTVQVAAGSLQTLANDNADPGSMTISGLPSKEYLFFRAVAAESNDTSQISGTNYTATPSTGATTSGGGSASNMAARALWRILTGTGDTLDPTLYSADCASVYVALEESSPVRTTAQAGDSDEASTWTGGVVPVDGESVIINHAVTVPAGTTFPATGDIADLTVNANLTVNGTLNFAGNAVFSGAKLLGSGTFQGNPASGQSKTIQFGTAHSQSNVGAFMVGASLANPAVIRKAAGSTGTLSVTDGGFFGGGQADMQYIHLIGLGSASVLGWRFWLRNSGNVFRLVDFVCDNVGRISEASGADGESVYLLRRGEFKNSPHTDQNVEIRQLDALLSGAGVREWDDVTFDVGVRHYASSLTVHNCRIFGQYLFLASTNPVDETTWHDNYLYKSGVEGTGFSIPKGALKRAYAVVDGGVGNPHFLTGQSGVDFITHYNECVMEGPGSTGTAGDGIVATSPSVANTSVVKYCILLPNADGDSPGKIVSMLGGANYAVSIEHCTYVSTAQSGEHGVGFGETYAGHAGMITSLKSNAVWTPGHRAPGSVLKRINNSVQDVVAPADCSHNGKWNLATGSDGVGYNGSGAGGTFNIWSGTAGGANDITDDPEFVDPDRRLAKWDLSLSADLGSARAVTSITRSGTLVTVTLTAHGYVKGSFVRIAGATPSEYNGDWMIESTPTADTFTFRTALTATTPASAPGSVTREGSVAHANAQLKARATGYTVSALIDYVRAGFAPTNPAYDGTAHDGGTIGAVPFAGGGPVTKTLSGSLAMSASLARASAVSRAGTLASSATSAKSVRVTRSGTLASSATLGTVKSLNSSVAGSLAPAGALVRSARKPVAASLATSGAISRRASRALSGATTLSGALLRSSRRALASALASTGALVRSARKSFAATASTSGTLSRAPSRALSASLASSGVNSTRTHRRVDASLTASATLARDARKSFTAAFSSSAALVTLKSSTRANEGTLSQSASLAKRAAKSLASSQQSSGTINVRVPKSLSAALSAGATIAFSVARSLAGVLASAGSLSARAPKLLASSLSTSATLSALSLRAKTLVGALASAGALSRRTQRAFAAVLASTGVSRRLVSRSLDAAQPLSGALVRSHTRVISATLSSSAALTRATTTSLSASLVTSAVVARRASKTTAASLSLAGALARHASLSLTASLSTGATLVGDKTSGGGIPIVLAGTLSSSGALARASRKVVVATLAESSTLARSVSRSLSASLSTSAVVSRRSSRATSGTLSPAGDVSATYGPVVSGALAPSSADVTRRVTRALHAVLWPDGSLTIVADVTLPPITKDFVVPVAGGVRWHVPVARESTGSRWQVIVYSDERFVVPRRRSGS